MYKIILQVHLGVLAVNKGSDGQLSATAYVILAVVLLGIISGLGWCFYRAVRAADKPVEPQIPDEVGDEQRN